MTMDRKQFLKTCGVGCLGILGGASLLSGCVGVKYVDANIEGSFLLVPLAHFTHETKDGFRKYLVVQNDTLSYPICVYRFSDTQYHALLMQCTHQGTELQAFGDRLQCPAHGSEFTSTGQVQNGPADEPLRIFPVTIDQTQLKINLQ